MWIAWAALAERDRLGAAMMALIASVVLSLFLVPACVWKIARTRNHRWRVSILLSLVLFLVSGAITVAGAAAISARYEHFRNP